MTGDYSCREITHDLGDPVPEDMGKEFCGSEPLSFSLLSVLTWRIPNAPRLFSVVHSIPGMCATTGNHSIHRTNDGIPGRFVVKFPNGFLVEHRRTAYKPFEFIELLPPIGLVIKIACSTNESVTT